MNLAGCSRPDPQREEGFLHDIAFQKFFPPPAWKPPRAISGKSAGRLPEKKFQVVDFLVQLGRLSERWATCDGSARACVSELPRHAPLAPSTCGWHGRFTGWMSGFELPVGRDDWLATGDRFAWCHRTHIVDGIQIALDSIRSRAAGWWRRVPDCQALDCQSLDCQAGGRGAGLRNLSCSGSKIGY